MLDALLAWAHFVSIFAFISCLLAEVFFYARTLSEQTLKRLARVDIAYGILVVAVVGTGIARVVFSPKTSAFYLHDGIFWTKMALFLAIGLLSIPPTIHFIRLRDAATDVKGTIEIAAGTYRTVRACMVCEVALMFFVPLCASLMAHGYGHF
jgi:putative membrane protein